MEPIEYEQLEHEQLEHEQLEHEQLEYEQYYKQTVIDFFNRRTRYDDAITIRRALPLLNLFSLQPGQSVLDLATGTGIIAIAAAQKVAQRVGQTGRVTGVDISTGMLHQAAQKIAALRLSNLELIEADVDHIDFPDASFDAVFCSTAIVYFRDIPATLSNAYRWLKPGGSVGFSCCSRTSCEAPLIVEVAAKYGITLSNINEATGTPERCRKLLQDAGFENIQINVEQLGEYRPLESMKQWNGGWFHPQQNPLLSLDAEQLEKLRIDYGEAIADRSTDQGVWYENLTFFVAGQKPGE
jgi:arsenite methyltransferase